MPLSTHFRSTITVAHLLLLTLWYAFACSEHEHTNHQDQEFTVMFHAVSGETHVSCGEPFALSDEEEPSFYLQDLRLFVYDVELKSSAGEWIPFVIESDGEWSDGVVTLLDYEDGGLHCNEGGDLLMNHLLRGTLPHGDYESIRFRVGVPYERNHQDVTLAEAPLNTSAMFWVWQRGYKFMRLELLEQRGEEMKPWLFHLGSTGCKSEAPIISPDTQCSRPNIPWITIENFDIENQHLVLDLRGLLNNLDLSANTEETPAGCMSMPLEVQECTPLFENLGLSFDSGEAEGCQGEVCSPVFRAMNNDHNLDSGHQHDGH